MKLEKVNPSKTVERIRMLLYGATGVGKTTLAASAADVEGMCPVLFCDCDRGLLSVRQRTEGIDFVEIENYQHLSAIFKASVDEDFPYHTLIIDGFGELYDLQLGIRTTTEGHELPELRDWYHMITLTKRMLRRMKRLPIHVIFTTLDTFDKEEPTGTIYRRPALPGQLAGAVGEHFDIIGWLSVSLGRSPEPSPVRLLQVQPFRRVAAKDRSGRLKPVVENPTMAQIYGEVMK